MSLTLNKTDPAVIVSPLCFAAHASGGEWLPARHLVYLDQAIHRAVLGPVKDRPQILILSAPPRHGKSELVSHWLPAWYLGVFPNRRVMLGSYSDTFARKWGRLTKQTLQKHGALFGVDVARDTRAANEWEIASHGGGMVTAGLGGTFTGRGAEMLIIDDPIKNAEEAISDNARESVWEWWRSTAWPRVEPIDGTPGLAVVMMTRWHEDDLVGRLQKWAEQEGIRIQSINLPALAGENDPLGRKQGEPLWPQRLPPEFLQTRRSMLGEYWWQALYQGHPGTYGKNEWPAAYFENVWAAPGEWPDSFDASAIALDPSKGKNAKRGDYSATVFVGLARGMLWVDAQVARRPVPVMCAESVAFAAEHGCDRFGVESNTFQDLLLGPLDEATEAAGMMPLPYSLINNTVNKQLRINRLGPLLARRKFRFRRAPGTTLLVDQLRGFPFAEHDDGPDALEMAIRLLRWVKQQGWRNDTPDHLESEVLVP